MRGSTFTTLVVKLPFPFGNRIYHNPRKKKQRKVYQTWIFAFWSHSFNMTCVLPLLHDPDYFFQFVALDRNNMTSGYYDVCICVIKNGSKRQGVLCVIHIWDIQDTGDESVLDMWEMVLNMSHHWFFLPSSSVAHAPWRHCRDLRFLSCYNRSGWIKTDHLEWSLLLLPPFVLVSILEMDAM